MGDLRIGLGTYHRAGADVPAGSLTLHETGELLRRGALAAGLVPVSEFPVHAHGKTWNVDWVWQTSSRVLVAAFEIDGRDIDLKNCVKALISLGSTPAPIRALVRFQVHHNLLPKAKATQHVDGYKSELDALGIERFMDTDLMAADGIEGLIARARAQFQSAGKGAIEPRSDALKKAVESWNDLSANKKKLVW